MLSDKASPLIFPFIPNFWMKMSSVQVGPPLWPALPNTSMQRSVETACSSSQIRAILILTLRPASPHPFAASHEAVDACEVASTAMANPF
ncbi:hypothetical protein NQZ68_004999 [Dissostichus eleginoides]|nr:hypothetical protein NQZ68_004999 [Dissostichus eleginoides]